MRNGGLFRGAVAGLLALAFAWLTRLAPSGPWHASMLEVVLGGLSLLSLAACVAEVCRSLAGAGW